MAILPSNPDCHKLSFRLSFLNNIVNLTVRGFNHIIPLQFPNLHDRFYAEDGIQLNERGNKFIGEMISDVANDFDKILYSIYGPEVQKTNVSLCILCF